MGSFSNRISRERFLEVYNKHLPNKWTKLAFKYFSTNTLDEDKWLNKIFFSVSFGLFILGFVFNLFRLSHFLIGVPTFLLLLWLLAFGIFRIGAFFMNNARIRKIRKELGISYDEYDILRTIYLN